MGKREGRKEWKDASLEKVTAQDAGVCGRIFCLDNSPCASALPPITPRYDLTVPAGPAHPTSRLLQAQQ